MLHFTPSYYCERKYRNARYKNKLFYKNILFKESDLWIGTDDDLTSFALESLLKYRTFIESYISLHKEFLYSLNPVRKNRFAPRIIQDMIDASSIVGVGPMASVAGSIAEYVGRDLHFLSKNVIVENGGDLYLHTIQDLTISIFAAESPFSNRLAIRIGKNEMPVGLCTSSASIGHSLSLGSADAVCVKAKTASLADTAATAIGNKIMKKENIKEVLVESLKIRGILGILVIMNDQMGIIGDIELVNL